MLQSWISWEEKEQSRLGRIKDAGRHSVGGERTGHRVKQDCQGLPRCEDEGGEGAQWDLRKCFRGRGKSTAKALRPTRTRCDSGAAQWWDPRQTGRALRTTGGLWLLLWVKWGAVCRVLNRGVT